MSRARATESKFVEENEEKYSAALSAAALVIYSDARLVGLEKIRVALAQHAALRACGWEGEPDYFVTPHGTGKPTQGIIDVCDEVRRKAIEAATDKLERSKQ